MPNSICSEGPTLYRQLHILGLKSESRGRLTAVIPGSWASHPDAVRIMTAGKKESRH